MKLPAALKKPDLMIERFDHIVLTVSDIEASVAFYTRVLQMREHSFGAGRKALCFGTQKINLQVVGQEAPAHMSLFPRFGRSFTGANRPLIRPPESHKLDYEGEIAIVIGKAGRRIQESDAYAHIAALTLCNEGTIRDWVRHAKFNVTQGKNWNNSGAIGPWLVPFEHAEQLDDIHLTTHVNGELRQDDRTGRMLFPIRRQIAYISTFTTLVPGDIIITGTPTGAGARFDPPLFLKPGDKVTVSAEGIGSLTNSVEDEI